MPREKEAPLPRALEDVCENPIVSLVHCDVSDRANGTATPPPPSFAALSQVEYLLQGEKFDETGARHDSYGLTTNQSMLCAAENLLPSRRESVVLTGPTTDAPSVEHLSMGFCAASALDLPSEVVPASVPPHYPSPLSLPEQGETTIWQAPSVTHVTHAIAHGDDNVDDDFVEDEAGFYASLRMHKEMQPVKTFFFSPLLSGQTKRLVSPAGLSISPSGGPGTPAILADTRTDRDGPLSTDEHEGDLLSGEVTSSLATPTVAGGPHVVPRDGRRRSCAAAMCFDTKEPLSQPSTPLVLAHTPYTPTGARNHLHQVAQRSSHAHQSLQLQQQPRGSQGTDSGTTASVGSATVYEASRSVRTLDDLLAWRLTCRPPKPSGSSNAGAALHSVPLGEGRTSSQPTSLAGGGHHPEGNRCPSHPSSHASSATPEDSVTGSDHDVKSVDDSGKKGPLCNKSFSEEAAATSTVTPPLDRLIQQHLHQRAQYFTADVLSAQRPLPPPAAGLPSCVSTSHYPARDSPADRSGSNTCTKGIERVAAPSVFRDTPLSMPLSRQTCGQVSSASSDASSCSSRRRRSSRPSDALPDAARPSARPSLRKCVRTGKKSFSFDALAPLRWATLLLQELLSIVADPEEQAQTRAYAAVALCLCIVVPLHVVFA